ncbi:MAG: hypothetical protein WCI12_09300 [Actinomycetes bacterium]
MATVGELIVKDAKAANLDPVAVLSVAQGEGGLTKAPGHYDPDTFGNPGWSYGPFQMRSPGRLPFPSVGKYGRGYDYAWSDKGIQAAISGIAVDSAGKTGPDAIASIVHNFEQPADEPSSIAAATARYKALQSTGRSVAPTGKGGGVWGAISAEAKALSQDRWYPGGSQGTAGKALGSLSSIGDLIGFVTSIRFVELIGGFALIIIGLESLSREFGVKTPIPNIPMAFARPA